MKSRLYDDFLIMRKRDEFIMTKNIQIAIDGPASAGKSTVAKILAKRNGYIYCDTGAMYRAVTFQSMSQQTDLDDEAAILSVLDDMLITFDYVDGMQHVYVNGVDVTEDIRTIDVTNNVSKVSAYKAVRQELVNRQKLIASENNIVMDGRDIGTVVLPNAALKIFLVASVDERAQRRFKENQAKGIDVPLETIKQDIEKRDLYDSTRKESPLVQASDAIRLDTTGMGIDDVVSAIESHLLKYT